MSEDIGQIDIRRKFTGLRRALRGRLAGEGLAWVSIAVLGLSAVTFGFDYMLHLDRIQRGLIVGICALGVLSVFWRRLLAPMLVPMTDQSLALLVEDRYEQFDGRLIGALQLTGRSAAELPGMSQAMIGKMAAQAEQIAGKLKFTSVVETRRLGIVSIFAGMGIFLILSIWVIAPNIMNLWFQRNILLRKIDYPQRTYLSVYAIDSAERIQLLMPNSDQSNMKIIREVEVLRGEDLQIITTAIGQAPHFVTLRSEYPSVGKTEENLSLASIAPWRNAIEKMQNQSMKVIPLSPNGSISLPSGGGIPPEIGYIKKFRAVSEEFTFFVTGGDDNRGKRSFQSRVKLVDPPGLEELTFAVKYPPYMRRNKLQTLTGDRGVLPLPRGANVQLYAVSNKPLDHAEILLDEKPTGQIKIIREKKDSSELAGRELRGSFAIPTKNSAPTATLKIRLQDLKGYSNPRGEKYIVHLLPDKAPEVTLHSRGVRHMISPQATIPLLTVALDDNGVDSIRMTWTSPLPKPAAPVPTTQPVSLIGTPITSGPEIYKKLSGERIWDIMSLKFPPGTKLQIYAEARDFLPADYGGPNISTSRALSFEIIPAEKLLGQLIGRQKEVRMEFFQAMGQQTLAHGRCQAVAEQAATGKIDAETFRKLADSADGERQVANESAKAEATLKAVAIELELNRLGKIEQHQAIRTEIVLPLQKLIEQMRSVASELDGAREIKSPSQLSARAQQIASQQEQILREMEEILKHMQKLEDRLELARRLEGLLKMSVELNTILRQRIEAGTDAMFDPVEKKK